MKKQTSSEETRKPNKEHIHAVVKALRSGDYVQTAGNLVKTEPDGSKKYCVVGVMQKLYLEAQPLSRFVTGISKDLVEYYGTFSVPRTLVEARFPDYKNHQWYVTSNNLALSYLNDIGFTFNELADLLEEAFLQPEPEENVA